MSLWNMHSELVHNNIDFTSLAGADNTIIAADPANELMVSTFVLTVDIATVIQIKFGSTVVGTFQLGALGSLNLSDVPGMDGETILRIAKNNALVVNSTAAARVTGTYKYGLKG